LVSVDNLKQLCATLEEAKNELKDGSHSSSKCKLGNESVLLMEKGHHWLYERMLQVEMPVLEEGNMKPFHDFFMKYYPVFLMFKEKFGHLRIPGEDPKNEWPGLQGWLKSTRATMSRYKKEGCVRQKMVISILRYRCCGCGKHISMSILKNIYNTEKG
jgi:hypothetical protein